MTDTFNTDGQTDTTTPIRYHGGGMTDAQRDTVNEVCDNWPGTFVLTRPSTVTHHHVVLHAPNHGMVSVDTNGCVHARECDTYCGN